MAARLYILRLKSSALYTGATTGLECRYPEYLKGTACRTTRLDPPVALVYSEQFPNFAHARRREAEAKKWSHAKKQALVHGDKRTLRHLAKSREHGRRAEM